MTVSPSIEEALAEYRPTRFEWNPEPPPGDGPGLPLAACIYCRISTLRQFEDSIEVQEAAQRAYFRALGIPIVAVFIDRGRSGMTIGGRPAIGALLRACEAGRVNVVGVATICRLSRSEAVLHRIASRLKAAGAALHEAHSGPIADIALAIAGHAAAQERANGLARMKDGLLHRMKLGRFPGIAPFGYLRVPSDRGLLLPHPRFQHVVLGIFTAAADGEPPEAIASRLDCPTPDTWAAAEKDRLDGGWPAWTGRMVIALLRNPMYKGIVTWGKTRTVRNERNHRRLRFKPVPQERWRAFDVAARRIVDPALWGRAQAALAERSRGRRASSTRGMVMLTGIAACACCGATHRGRHDRSGSSHAYACSATVDCRPSRASVGRVERAVARAVAGALRSRRAEGLPPDDRSAAWGEEFQALDDVVRRSLRGVLDGSDVPPSDGLLCRRRDSLAHVLRSDADDVLDLEEVVRLAQAAAEAPGDMPLADAGRETFDAVRALVARVEVGKEGTFTRLRVFLDLGPVAAQISGADLFPILCEVVDDAGQDPATLAAGAAATAAGLVTRSAGEGGVALSGRASGLLARLGTQDFRSLLSHLGWTLPDLIVASALWVRTGVRPEDQGLQRGRETYEEARRAVAACGLRGEIFGALEGAEAGLADGHLKLFSGRPEFAHLDPAIERAIAAAQIGRVSGAASPACGDEVRCMVVDWLRRTASAGRACTAWKAQASLTAALAAIRRSGVDALLATGPAATGDLKAELGAWSDAGGERAASAAAIMADHLRGASRRQVADAHRTSLGRVDHLVVRYRAVGPWGMAQWGNRSGPGRSRLSLEKLIEVSAEAGVAEESGASVECVAQAIFARFGVSYDLDRLRTRLGEAGIVLPLRREGLGPSKAQARAEVFLNAPFLDP